MMFKRNWASGLLVLAATTGVPAQAGEADVAAVEEAVAAFHVALNIMFEGDGEPIKALWSRADDTTYMGPTGDLRVGWGQIAPLWDEQAANKLGGHVGVTDLHVVAGPEVGVATYYEKGENVVDGKPQTVSIRTTTSFRKEGDAWKVIGHHTDTLPYLVGMGTNP